MHRKSTKTKFVCDLSKTYVTYLPVFVGNIFEDNSEEDLWGDDSDEISNSGSSLRREWISRHNRFHTVF